MLVHFCTFDSALILKSHRTVQYSVLHTLLWDLTGNLMVVLVPSALKQLVSHCCSLWGTLVACEARWQLVGHSGSLWGTLAAIRSPLQLSPTEAVCHLSIPPLFLNLSCELCLKLRNIYIENWGVDRLIHIHIYIIYIHTYSINISVLLTSSTGHVSFGV